MAGSFQDYYYSDKDTNTLYDKNNDENKNKKNEEATETDADKVINDFIKDVEELDKEIDKKKAEEIEKADNKYKDLADKYRTMVENRKEYNSIDIGNFIPTINEMMKEDCVIELLNDTAKEIGSNDNYLNVAFYAEEPFSKVPGYYPKEGVFVLAANHVYSDQKAWALNSMDGDTLYFPVDNLESNGKFTVGSREENTTTYEDFQEYAKKQLGIEAGGKLALRFAGINAPELPHYSTTFLLNNTTFKEYTIKELKDMYNKGKDVNFLSFVVDRKGTNDFKHWTVKDRDDDEIVKVYVVNNESYYEVVEKDIINPSKKINPANYMEISNNYNKSYTPYVLVSKNEAKKEYVLDAYKAQYRLKYLLDNMVDESNNNKNLILVLDNNVQSFDRTYPTFTVFQSLYKFFDNVKNLISTWSDAYNDNIPMSRLNYRAFGVDAYNRSLGALYANIKTNNGTMWVNVAKYVLVGSDYAEAYPNFKDSSELNGINDGFSDALNLDSYSNNGYRYLDDLDANGERSYEERNKLHKQLTGIDFDKVRDCTLMIGDFLCLLPPQNIRNVTNIDYEKLPIIRGKGAMVKNKANREQIIEIDLFFYGDSGINGIEYEASVPNKDITYTYYMNGLRALLSQFRLAPFLPIENEYINEVLGITVVALVNFAFATVEGFPHLLKATLTLRDFNYEVYMPDLPLHYYDKDEQRLEEISEADQIFGKCFEWEVFRYYYQRAIMHGEELSKYDFNSFSYSEKFYSFKNAFQPNDLTDNYMEIFIPDEQWLKNALQYKKSIDYSGQIVSDLSPNEEELQWLKDVASLQNQIKLMDDVLSDFNEDLIKSKAANWYLINPDSIYDSSNPLVDLEDIFGKKNKTYINTQEIELNYNGSESPGYRILKKHIFDGIVKKIKENPIVNNVTVDENNSKRGNGIVEWDIIIELNVNTFSKGTKGSLSKMKEIIKTLAGKNKSSDVFIDNRMHIYITAPFDPTKREDGYIPNQMRKEVGDDLNAIIKAYYEEKKDSESMSINGKELQWLKEIASIQNVLDSANMKKAIDKFNNDLYCSKSFVPSLNAKPFNKNNFIPEYTGNVITVINNNIPSFDQVDKSYTKSVEKYSSLDPLGRCGAAFACLGFDSMPNDDRGDISNVKPTGWQNNTYDFIENKYLYNRCHLIGYQLSGENDNVKNLITGTNYFNVEGMLPYENMVANFIKTNPKKHVLYRVTPMYEGNDLVAKGVKIEGYSLEDKGKSISFAVFAHNVQPGVKINYSDGTNRVATTGDNMTKIEDIDYTVKDIFRKDKTKTDIKDNTLYENAQDLLIANISNNINKYLTDIPIIESVVTDEIFSQNGSMQWSIQLKPKTNNINMDMVRKGVKILTNSEDEKDCIVDDTITLSLTCLYNSDGYINNSVELKRSSELKSIINSFKNYNKSSAIITNNNDNYENIDSEDDANLLGTNQIMFDYTKYKEPACMKFIPYLTDTNGNSQKIDLDEISFNMSNTFTELYLKAVDGYAPQFLGGSDIVVEVKLTTVEKTLAYALNKLSELLTQYTKIYRKVMPCAPLKIKNSYMQTIGLNEMLLDTVHVETIDGIPGAYQIYMRMTSVDRSIRQREALKKLDANSYTASITEASIINMFAIQDELAKAELYPDLDLPTIKELENNGWRYLKYINEKRLFVDPDFYILYSFKYTAQTIKEIMFKYVYKMYLGDEGLEKLQDKNNSYKLEDSSLIKVDALFDNILGSTFENSNEYAKEYDKILNDIDSISQNEKLKDRFKTGQYQNLRDLSDVGSSLTYLASMGLLNGWTIRKSNFDAVLADNVTNTAISKLNKSGIDNSNAEEQQKDDKIIEEIYDRRCKAIELIDNILSQPIGHIDDYGSNNSMDMPLKDYYGKKDSDYYTYTYGQKYERVSGKAMGINTPNSFNTDVKEAILRVFVKNKHGRELLKLLNSDTVEGLISNSGGIYAKTKTNISTEVYGHVDHAKLFKGELYDEINILNYIQAYMFAAAHALTNATDENVDVKRENDPYISIKNSDKVIVHLKDNDNDWDKVMDKVYKAKGGGTFGVYRIGTYSTEQLINMTKPDEYIKYKKGKKNLNIMYHESDKKGLYCEDNAFIDPYYNHAGHRSKIGKDYKKKIIQNASYNAEAFLRIVLVYLKRMIIEGYFFNEIDVTIDEYMDYTDEISSALLTGSNTIGHTGNNGAVQLTMGNDLKQLKEQQDGKDALKTILGTDVDQTIELLRELPNLHKKVCCARLIYPFIAAITNYDKGVMKYIEDRDYNKLNTFTNCQTVGSESNNVFDRFLNKLVGLRLINVYDASDADTSSSTSVSQKINNLIMQEAFTACANDPRQYVLHSFYDMVRNDKRGRLLRAFPTYYIVFIDEGRKIGTWKLFDNFYNMSSISELQIVKSRKIPADTCTFTMSNAYMSYAESYDNSIYQQYVDIYGVKDIVDSLIFPSSYVEKEDLVRKRKQLKDTTVLSPGVRIHVRMGYGADASTMPIVFNGKVAELEFGETVQVVCQGDGHELCNPLNALGELTAQSFQTSQHMITAFKDIRGSFMRGGESPRNLASKLLNAEYNGVFKTIIREQSNRRFFANNPFGIYHFGDKRFQDIFDDGETVQNLYEVSNETLLGGYNTLVCDKSVTTSTPTINCTLQDKTYWEILNMCANSGDGYYAAIRDFGFRSTACLCKANHYYAYEYNKNETNGVVYERRKPFQQFHYCDSYNDIVYNTMKATEKNMKTNAVGTWQSTDFIWGTSQDTVGPIFLDMNIYPEYQKSMTVDTGLVAGGNGGINFGPITNLSEQWTLDPNDDKVNKSLAEKITTNVLRQSVKDMYEGEICIIGNSSIKPFDSFCFVDAYEDMSGTVEVETVIHNLNAVTGFTTTIIPDLVTCTESIEQRVGAKRIYGSFIQGAIPLLSSASLRLAINYLPKYKTMTTTGSRFIISSLSALQSWLSSKGASTGALNLIKAMLPANPVGAIILAIAAASTYVLVKNVKDAIYRTLRNIQAITVFPVVKNQRPLVAGMAGHRGSVFGYSYPEGTKEDSIQGMVEYLFEETGILGGAMRGFMSDYDIQGVFNNWNANLLSNDKDIMSDEYDEEKNRMIFMNDTYNTISKEFSNRASQYRSLKTKIRINSNVDSNKLDEDYLETIHDEELDEFLEYQIGGIYNDKNNEKYKKVDPVDKRYVEFENLTSNVKLQSLLIVEDDDEIRLATEPNKHPIIKEFTFSHNHNNAPEVNLLRESGNRKVRYITDRKNGDDVAIYDLPLLHADAMSTLKLIINDSNLQDSRVNLASGVRVNDVHAWNSTGLNFTLTSSNFNGLVKAIENVRNDTKWYSSDKEKYMFNIVTDASNDAVGITVFAPKETKGGADSDE